MDTKYLVIIGRDGKRRLVVQKTKDVGQYRQATKKDIRHAAESLRVCNRDLEEYLLENLREDIDT